MFSLFLQIQGNGVWNLWLDDTHLRFVEQRIRTEKRWPPRPWGLSREAAPSFACDPWNQVLLLSSCTDMTMISALGSARIKAQHVTSACPLTLWSTWRHVTLWAFLQGLGLMGSKDLSAQRLDGVEDADCESRDRCTIRHQMQVQRGCWGGQGWVTGAADQHCGGGPLEDSWAHDGGALWLRAVPAGLLAPKKHGLFWKQWKDQGWEGQRVSSKEPVPVNLKEHSCAGSWLQPLRLYRRCFLANSNYSKSNWYIMVRMMTSSWCEAFGCFWAWTSPDGRHGNQIDYILSSERWRSSIQSAKTRPGADCGSDHELLIAKFRLKLNEMEKTTRPFRYDLNQIPYDYTVEVRNRFKGLDVIDRVPDELWMEVRDIVEESRPFPRKRNAKKQNGCLRRPYK